MSRWPLALAGASLLSGCVSMKRYDQALLAYSEAHQQQVASQQVASSVAQAADERQLERDALAAERDALAAELAALTEVAMARATQLRETQDRLVAAIDDSSALSADVEAMRTALDDAQRRKAEADAALRDYRDLVARFQGLIDAGTLQVRVVDGRMLLALATDILFAPASASVSQDGATALREVAGILATLSERDFQVAGHTDSVPINTQRFPSNWELGAARATAVLHLLRDGGLAPERLSAATYGQYKPSADNEQPQGRAANRRIEIVVMPDLSRLPGFAELEAQAGEP